MKKALALVLALVFVLCTVPAFAAGKLSVAQENFYLMDGYSLYAYCYAKVENTGDKAIKVNSGLLEVFNADGDAILSRDYISKWAEYLQPGEYTYVRCYDTIKDATIDDVDDYTFEVNGKAENDQYTLRLPVECSYVPNVKEGYWTYNYMYATVTNNTDQTLYGISVVLVLLDADGNILYMEDEDMWSTKGLLPGSSIVVRESVSSSFMEYFEANGITPVAVDAIAYVNLDA